MTTENRFKEGMAHSPDPGDAGSENQLTGKEAYHLVSDTVTGLNVRKSDNKFQALFILISVLVLAMIGACLVALFPAGKLPWYGGAFLGGLAGLPLGLLASGLYLMIYRGIRHMKGDHS